MSMDWYILSQVNNDRQGMVEVRNVEVIRSSQAHVDSVGSLVIDDLGHHLESVGQSTGEGHLLVVPAVLPEDFHQVVVQQLLDKLIRSESVIQDLLSFYVLGVGH